MNLSLLRPLAAILCLSTATAAFAQDKTAGGQQYALLVAVREYDKNELRNLAYTENDINSLAQTLKKSGYRRVVVMSQTVGATQTRHLPLAANIRKELKGLVEDRREGDSVIVAFAGHGVQFRGEEEPYFCPADARLKDKQSLIALGEVYKMLEQCQAGSKLLMVDACRNDPQSDFSRSRQEVQLESVTRPQRKLPQGGVVALFSCSAGEKAFESPDLKHGIFFHYVVEGLKGKAASGRTNQVTVNSLIDYVQREVNDKVKEEFGADVRQMPESKGTIRGAMPLVKVTSGDQYRSLFNGKDLAGWVADDGNLKKWRVENGELIASGSGYNDKGWLLTERTYGDFALRFQFQLSSRANSGIALRAVPAGYAGASGPARQFEVQIVDDESAPKAGTGGLHWKLKDGFLPPSRPAKLDPLGSWNSMYIGLRGQTLRVAVNNKEVLTKDLNELATEPGAFAALNRTTGQIGIQRHTGEVRFKDIQLMELKKP